MKKTKPKKSVKAASNPIGIQDDIGALGFLGSGKTMFSGFKMNLGVGDKGLVLGKGAPTIKGHMPQSKFAQLSDGSKVTLTGPNKGLIVKK